MLRFGKENQATFNIIFDGEALPAYPGDTVASALYASGKRAWRRSRAGDERGLLCGIGLCFDCLVTIDGIPNQRACQVMVKDSMVIQTNLQQG